MKLSEILEEIAEKYPHSLSNTSVIRKLNLIQNELFRTTYKLPTLNVYNLKKDVIAYTLPFPFSNIRDIVVDGVEYPYQDLKTLSISDRYYYFLGKDILGIYPTPKKDVVGGLNIFHYRSAAQLTESDLTVVPDFDADFHMLLVYGALTHIAENYADVAMVNNFTSKYNGLLDEFLRKATDRPDYPVIQDVMGGLF